MDTKGLLREKRNSAGDMSFAGNNVLKEPNRIAGISTLLSNGLLQYHFPISRLQNNPILTRQHIHDRFRLHQPNNKPKNRQQVNSQTLARLRNQQAIFLLLEQ